METIILKKQKGQNKLRYAELPIPKIGEDEVLVQVKAIGINPIDLKTKDFKGIYERLKDQDPIILGWDVSGVVIKSNSANFISGDEVFGLINFPGHGKAYAEFIACPADHLAKKPKNCTHLETAATSLAALTAYQAMQKLGVQSKDKVLIHAASGGVGHFAVQIAKYLSAFVVGTSSQKNKDFVMGLGADKHIDYHTDQLEKEVERFDIVFDPVGGETIDRSLSLMKKGSKIMSIPSGKNEEVIEKAQNNGKLGLKFTVASSREDIQTIANYLENGILKPHISNVYDFTQMQKAHEHLAAGHTVGKIVVEL